jgi:hypothetical protein
MGKTPKKKLYIREGRLNAQKNIISDVHFAARFFFPFFFFALVCPSSLSMYFLFQSTAAAQKISEINTKGKQHEKERHQHQQQNCQMGHCAKQKLNISVERGFFYLDLFLIRLLSVTTIYIMSDIIWQPRAAGSSQRARRVVLDKHGQEMHTKVG